MAAARRAVLSLTLVLGTLGLCIGVRSAGAVVTPPANVLLNNPTGDPVNGTQANPALVSLGAKVVAVWHNNVATTNENQFQYAVSVDSGATFTDLGVVPAPTSPVVLRWRLDPQIVAKPSTGEVWVAGQVSTLTPASPTHAGIAIVRGVFSGNSLLWGTPTLVRDFTSVTILQFNSVALEIDPATSDLHLLYTNNYAPAHVVEYQKSVGGVIPWTTPVQLSSAADSGDVSAPQLAVGPGSEIHAAWSGKRSGTHVPIRYRNSIGGGGSWQAEQTVATVRYQNGVPGAGTFTGDFSMAANRVTGSDAEGRVAISWAETWELDDESFPPMTLTPIVAETETNDTTSTANPFTIGDAITGTFAATTDRDFWKITLGAGDQIALVGDSITSVQPLITIVEPGGAEYLLTGLGFSPGRLFSFRAPVAGTYFVRCAPRFTSFTVPSFYRVRTRTSASLAGEARDQRDLVVAHSVGSGASLSWASPVRYPFTTVGYDDLLPTLGWGADGLDYVSWYDFSAFPTGGRSNLVVARNLAGLDPVPSPPQPITSTVTAWTTLAFLSPPAMGWSNAVRADDRRVLLGWADGRAGNPDAYSARLATTALAGPCQGDTTVQAGQTTQLAFGLVNQSPIFAEKVRLTAAGARAWPGTAALRDSVTANEYGVVHYALAVPDSAAGGTYPLCITLRRQGGAVIASCCVNLTVVPVATGVGNPRDVRFALERPAPNPARGAVSFAFALPREAPARLEVFGVGGERVRTLIDGVRPAGAQRITWDGTDHDGARVRAGIYFVRLGIPGQVMSRRLLLLE